ncbi:hypothetical protein P5673_012776 [Acropora cervicornis]|uniref:Uncharacterized protein n=1 Tax=Acropora cervicornis TaxID=6130 RepID=A0AAD9QLZ0_ACRCE|nr:hypothetical protein P5673_012776 [Acropora cervicornis]
MKMAGDCDAFEDEFAYIFELTDNRSRKPSLFRGFLPIILAFPNLIPSVEAVSDVCFPVPIPLTSLGVHPSLGCGAANGGSHHTGGLLDGVELIADNKYTS